MNDNKHKVAFYFVLVFLLVTLRHCHGSKEVISKSAALPKNSTEITSLEEYKRSYATKSVSEKLTEIRSLFKTLIFDWSLNGESAIAGRTFGIRRRLNSLLVPVAFLGGFLTAVIMGIKIIGVINMLLITGVLVLNLAVILGKLFYAKMNKYGNYGPYGPPHHNHHGHGPPSPYYGPNSYADSRADSSLPFRRNFNSPQFPGQPNFNQPQFPGQPNLNQPQFPGQPNLNQPGFQDQPNLNQPGFQGQPNLNQPGFQGQPNSNQPGIGQNFNNNQIAQGQFDQAQPAFPQNFNQPSISQQQPPTNFQPQPQNSQFGGIQMQAPQQQAPAAPTGLDSQIGQAPNQAPMNSQFSSPSDFSSPMNGMRLLSTTTEEPAAEIEMINLQEIPLSSSMSPLDILNDALAKMGEKAIKPSDSAVPRFKRKSSRRHLSLLKSFR